MAKMTTEAERTYATVEDGAYPATLKKVEAFMPETGYQGAPPKLRFTLDWELDPLVIENEQGVEEEVTPSLRSWATVPKVYKNGGSKPTTMVTVLTALGIPLPPPESEYDTDDWIGARCQLVVATVERDGKTFNNITNYMKLSRAKRAVTGAANAF